MEVTKEFLRGYAMQLDSLADVAESDLIARLSTRWLQMRAEGVPASEILTLMRDEAGSVLDENDRTYGVASASLGANAIRETLDEGNSRSARYWAKFLDGTDEGFERFLGGICAKTRRNVTHMADWSIADIAVALNRERKYTNGVRFARVPNGPSCGFCIMLASRGFVYASAETAGEFKKYHDSCDCRIIAGTKGTKVVGYDPDALYERYARCVRAINGDTLNSSNGRVYEDWERLSDEERASWGKKAKHGEDAFNNYFEHRVCREMDTRDREWLWSGTCRATRLAGREDVRRFKQA